MAKQQTYDTFDQDGLVREFPIGMAPIKARTKTLDSDGAEIHSGHLVVNPLNRQPSIKDMVTQLKRSGELGARIRAADNLARAEDGDPTFEGYSREWLEENWLSNQEAEFIYDSLPPEELADAVSSPSGTAPAPTTSTQTDDVPSPKDVPSQASS